ncbi:hypothetical protein ACFGVR_13380 [Mucilaginibacter sp. AW1-3]
MKPVLLTCTIVLAVLFTGCSGLHGNVDMHKTLALVMILIIIALFFILAIYSNLLRDDVDCHIIDAKVEQAKLQGKTRFRRNTAPFSLSRVQLALWTVIISCSYIYLTLGRGSNCPNPPDINQTALILMGIGAAVTASGALIDKNDIHNHAVRHQDTPSAGFFVDILSDAQGISIPRFQNVIWTGIAMIIYLNKVYMAKTGCALPELDQTLLALTGISNVTYLALKTQENNTSATAAPVAQPANPVAPQPQVAPVVPQAPVAPVVPPVNPVVPPANPATSVVPPAPVIPAAPPAQPAAPVVAPPANTPPPADSAPPNAG